MLILFCVRQMNISELCKDLSPESLVRLLQSNANICESVVHEQGGSVVRLLGEYIIMAWKADHVPVPDYSEISKTMAQKISEAREKIKSGLIRKASISISMTKGDCVFEQDGNHFTHVFGTPMNRVLRIADKFLAADKNVILVDESLKTIWSNYVLESIGDGVFRVQ